MVKSIRSTHRKIAWLYTIFSAIFLFMFIFAEAPFQEPDSFNHFYRAYQIATGHLIGTKYNKDASGGKVPQISDDFWHDTMSIAFDRNKNTIKDNYNDIFYKRIWDNIKDVQFPNTAFYFPISYTPQSIAIVISNFFNFTIFQTFVTMRIFAAIFSLFILSLSVFICPNSCRFALLFVLSIPEVNIICSSISFDSMVLCESVISSVFICRAICEKNINNKIKFIILYSIISSFVVASKPPYFILLFIPMFINVVTRISWAKIFTISILSMCVPLIWFFIGVKPIMTPTNPLQADAHKQLYNLLSHPFYIFHVIWNSIRFDGIDLVKQCIGTIRWTGPWLPDLYCLFVVIIAAIITMLWIVYSRNSSKILKIGFLIFFVMLSSAFFIAISIYLSWSPVAASTFWGLNGRYFTVLLMFLPIAFAGTNISFKLTYILERILVYGFYPFSFLVALRTMLLINWQ